MWYIIGTCLRTGKRQRLDGFVSMSDAIKTMPEYIVAYGRGWSIDIGRNL